MSVITDDFVIVLAVRRDQFAAS